MQSELAAVDNEGLLRQWRWEKEKPYRHSTYPNVFHPRAIFLNVEDKKVRHYLKKHEKILLI